MTSSLAPIGPRLRRAASASLVWLLGVGLPGCALFGGQTGQESERMDPGCMSEQREPLAPDSDPGLGFSAQNVIDLASARRTGLLHWHRTGQATTVELEVLATRMPLLATSTQPDLCPGRIVIPARVRITTDDGQLREELELELGAENPEQVSAHADIEPARLVGTWTAAAHDLDESLWTEPTLFIQLRIDASDGLSGSLSFGGGDPNPRDDASPVSAAIAEF